LETSNDVSCWPRSCGQIYLGIIFLLSLSHVLFFNLSLFLCDSFWACSKISSILAFGPLDLRGACSGQVGAWSHPINGFGSRRM
jgi:hypothetical protein